MSIELNRTAILLTAHPRQQKWWAPVLLSLELYPGPLILSYDDIDVEPIPVTILRPFKKIVVTGVKAGQLGHARGEIACIRNGLIQAEDIGAEFVLKLGFDEPVWRWRNITRLMERLVCENLDCIHNQTRLIFGRTKPLYEAFGKYEIESIETKPAEAHWRGLIKEFDIKNDCIIEYDYWMDLLGLIHLQGEYAANIGKPNKWSWEIGEIWKR